VVGDFCGQGPLRYPPFRQWFPAMVLGALGLGALFLSTHLSPDRRESAPRLESWVGDCTAVIDGETIRVTQGDRTRNVRLHCVDAPDRSQPWATRAEQHLSAVVLGRTVSILARGYDDHRHRCVEADVVLPDGTTANERQLRAGLARYVQRDTPGNDSLRAISYVARLDHRGVWAEAQTESVWD
jgi:endonuclease YncB( thermonuclease family)